MRNLILTLLGLISLTTSAQQVMPRDNSVNQVNTYKGVVEANGGLKIAKESDVRQWATRDSLGLIAISNDSVPVYHNGTNWGEFSKVVNRVTIQYHSDDNKRNDQASMIRLYDGRLMVAYSHFGPGSEDLDESSVHIQYSSDNGKTWTESEELIAPIALGSYIPSLYKKANGNVLLVFFVREQATPVFLSSLRSIEYSPDMTTIVTPMETILSASGYSPVGSDRLFYDENTDRLLMPYPVLTSGSGASTVSIYQTRFLISDDEGDTWADSGLTFDGFLNLDNVGGAMEPGFFVNKDKITIYSRNIVGNINACDLTWTGSAYTKGTEYKLKIGAMNAQSTIKFVPELRAWVASYTRLYDTPTSTRNRIDVSISRDATNWQKLLTVDDLLQVGGYMVNEPNILIDDKIYLTYSIDKTNGTYDLKLVTIPFESLMGIDNKTLDTYTANPTISEANEVSRSRFLLTSSFDASVFNNIFRSYVDIKEDVVSATPSSRSLPAYAFGQYFTNKAATVKHFNMGVTSTLAPQQIFDGIYMEGQVHKLYFASFSANSLKNGAHLEHYSPITIEEILPTGVTTGTIGAKYAFEQKGLNDRSYFLGHLGLGTNNPLYQLDVTGQIHSTGKVIVDTAPTNANDVVRKTELDTKADASTAIKQGGNTFGTAMVIGTQDNFATSFLLNNALKAQLTSVGYGLLGTVYNLSSQNYFSLNLGSSVVSGTITRNNNDALAPLIVSNANQSSTGNIQEWTSNIGGTTALRYSLNKSGTPSNTTDLTDKEYVDAADALKANKAGDTYTGTHNFTGATLTVDTPAPLDFSDKAANTEYVDLAIATALAGLPETLSGSASLDFGSTASGTSSELTITVTGAEPGDAVFLGVPSSANQSNSCYTAVVTTADTVDVRFNNYSGSPIDPGSGTFTAKIIK